MKKFKKALAMLLSLVLTAALAISGTIAYLTWQDSKVNVMTMGNVKIEQFEMERVFDENGNVIDMQPFTQGQTLMPAVVTNGSGNEAWAPNPGTDINYGDYIDGAQGSNGTWLNLNNEMDKFVFVKNTGKSDAYYRTIIAFEAETTVKMKNSYDQSMIHFNINGNNRFTWDDAEIENVEINGVKYNVFSVLYNEVLKPGEISRPSLLQVGMDQIATNEYVAQYGDTFDILVLSQAVQTAGFESAGAALDEAFGDVNAVNAAKWFGGIEDYPIIVSNEQELKSVLADATDAKSGDNTIYLTGDIELTEDWTPISVDGYHGAGIITVEGQGNTITGLTAPLFDGGFAGNSGIIIRDLTIADSTIKSNDTQGAGAFISCVDSMATITLENCHLLNSTVDAPKARTGGLIGWTSGYSKQNDGPVKTYVTITDCSVKNCKITGTAVGGINGHAGASDWTFTTIENCTVVNNELISYDNGGWRVGDVIGTANIGEVTIKNTTYGGNTLKQENASSQHDDSISELVGRAVLGTTGKLTVDGSVKVAEVSATDELKKALESGATTISMGAGTYDIPSAIAGKAVTLIGTEGTVIDFTKPQSVNGASITFENIKFQGINANVSDNFGIHHTTSDIVYKNCTFDGAVTNEHTANVDYIDCTFTGIGYITTYSVPSIDFVNCTFDKADSRALLVYSHGNCPVKVTVNGCTFKAAAKGYTGSGAWTAAVEVDTTNIKTAGTTVTIENCTTDGNYSGIVRDKSAASAVKAVITVDGAVK